MNRFIVALALLPGCVSGKEYRGVAEECIAVSVWTENEKVASLESLLSSCDLWWREGIACKSTESEIEADVVVYVSYEACEVDEDGQERVAHAFDDGRIVLNVDCSLFPTNPDGQEIVAILSHELGHTFGIKGHIPRSAGRAIMNPKHALHYESELDHEAFLKREFPNAADRECP